jgi:recombination protein RecA
MAPRKKKDTLTGLSTGESIATGLISLDDLNSFRKELKKEFGDSSGIEEDDFVTSFIPTEIDALDYYLGGGLPVGKICEVAGREGTGKSSFGIHMLGKVQKQNGLCVFIDTEAGGAGDKYRFEHFGVDPKRVLINEEDKAEKVFGIIERTANFVVQKNLTVPSLIVVDSVAGLTTAAELEASMDTAQFAAVPRMIGKGVRKVKMLCRESNISVLFINQSRVKIGGMVNSYTGPEMTTPGGDALKFAAITRLFMERGATLQDATKKQPYGHIVKTKIIKCKTSSALNRTLPMAFFYDKRGYYNPKICFDLLRDSGFWGKEAWKTVIMQDGSEKRFNSEKTFFDLYEESEENRQHFLTMMKAAFNTKLGFSSDPDDHLDGEDSDTETLLSSSEYLEG